MEESFKTIRAAVESYNRNLPQAPIETSEVHKRGPYTIVIVREEGEGGRIGVGVSKCAPCDKFDLYTGTKLALQRAIHEFHTQPVIQSLS